MHAVKGQIHVDDAPAHFLNCQLPILDGDVPRSNS